MTAVLAVLAVAAYVLIVEAPANAIEHDIGNYFDQFGEEPAQNLAIRIPSGGEGKTLYAWIDVQCIHCKTFIKRTLDSLGANGYKNIFILPAPIKDGSEEVMRSIWCSEFPADALSEHINNGIAPESSYNSTKECSEKYKEATFLSKNVLRVDRTPILFEVSNDNQ